MRKIGMNLWYNDGNVMHLYNKFHWPSIRGSCLNELVRKLNVKFVDAAIAGKKAKKKVSPSKTFITGETKNQNQSQYDWSGKEYYGTKF